MGQFDFTTLKKTLRGDIFAGLTVALALVPEAVAFAFVAGVDPLVGLYAAFIVGFVTSIFGGRPGMISGATGALAVVMVSLVKEGNEMGAPGDEMGLYYLFVTVILMGIIQILAGLFKLGKFARLIPHPVMLGFVNGLAIVIFLSQLEMFKEHINGEHVWLKGKDLFTMLALVVGTMGMMWGLPKINKKIPGGLIAIVSVSLLVIFTQMDVATVGSFIRDGGGTGLKGGLPIPQLDLFQKIPLNLETLSFVFPYALILALIGLTESLMTLNLIDELTETHGNSNRECIALGSANVITGFFGGMGGCAMIGQSLININSGGRSRVSGAFAAVTLLFFILFASSLIEAVPIAALVGVMFMVVIGTFAWSSLQILHKIPAGDALAILLVTILTVKYDLAIAVIAGVILSALIFSWENAKRIRARKTILPGKIIYEIWGPLFFGSITEFNKKFDFRGEHEEVVIDFLESRVCDHSGVEAIQNLVDRFESFGKKVKLKHLSHDCSAILCKVNPHLSEVIEEAIDDPKYNVMMKNEEFI